MTQTMVMTWLILGSAVVLVALSAPYAPARSESGLRFPSVLLGRQTDRQEMNGILRENVSDRAGPPRAVPSVLQHLLYLAAPRYRLE